MPKGSACLIEKILELSDPGTRNNSPVVTIGVSLLALGIIFDELFYGARVADVPIIGKALVFSVLSILPLWFIWRSTALISKAVRLHFDGRGEDCKLGDHANSKKSDDM